MDAFAGRPVPLDALALGDLPDRLADAATPAARIAVAPLLRKAAARTREALETAITAALDAFVPGNAATTSQTQAMSLIDPKML